MYEISKDCFDPFWRAYYAGEYSEGFSGILDEKADSVDGIWKWRSFFLNKQNAEEIVFPCRNDVITPAIGALLAGVGITVKVSCHHELGKTRKLLFRLAGRIIPCSATIAEALKVLKVSSEKIAPVELPQLRSDLSFAGDGVTTFEKPTVLALPTTASVASLRNVVHIASIVYNARADFNLVVCISNDKDKAVIERLESNLNSRGMCICVNNNELTPAMINGCFMTLNGPDAIDDPLRFMLVCKLGKTIVVGKSARADFDELGDCIIIETEFKRQFASAVFAELKNMRKEKLV